MSLFPLNLDRYKEWSIKQLYYHLFPFIKEDFMGRQDCALVHTDGNMQAVVAGSTGTVTHITRGGSDNLLAVKETEYRTYVEQGTVVIQTAQELGEFVG
jgi:hypothetical protein